MTQLSKLLERVEKATGPDREIDHALHDLFGSVVPLGGFIPYLWRIKIDDKWVDVVRHARAMMSTGDVYVQDYTASLDACVALAARVLPGCSWHIGDYYQGTQEPMATVYRDKSDDADCYYGDARTVPLAFLAVILRALIAKEAAHDD